MDSEWVFLKLVLKLLAFIYKDFLAPLKEGFFFFKMQLEMAFEPCIMCKKEERNSIMHLMVRKKIAKTLKRKRAVLCD